MRCFLIMKNKIVPFEQYQPISDDIVLLDTNILIRLLYSTDFDNHSTSLETLFQKLLKSKCRLLISSIQISEFINRCIRLQYNIYKETNNLSDYEFKKDYRNSNNYRECMKAILDIINTDIINTFEFIDDHFHSMDKSNIFQYGFSYDFNDSLLCEIAKDYKATLVTNDSDYGNYIAGLKIVTSNRFLLMLQ